MESKWSTPTDPRDTGQHFFGALTGEPTEATQVAANRIADLTAHIEFLDSEVDRYRDLLEQERIRHTTELSNQQLISDSRVDEQRIEERQQIQALHESYRALLTARQVEFEQALSDAAKTSADELADERRRQEMKLQRVHARRERILETSRQQAIEEINAAHEQALQALEGQLSQRDSTIDRLQSENATLIERAEAVDLGASRATKEIAELKRRLELVEGQHRSRIEEAEARIAAAEERLNAERRRSAATLAELLERSASIAAEADTSRLDLSAQQAAAERAAAHAIQRAQADVAELAAAADAQAARAIDRETELEGAIAELRQQLAQGEQ